MWGRWCAQKRYLAMGVAQGFVLTLDHPPGFSAGCLLAKCSHPRPAVRHNVCDDLHQPGGFDGSAVAFFLAFPVDASLLSN